MKNNDPISAGEFIGVTFFTTIFTIVMIAIGWSVSHPTQDQNVACIRAGYDTSEYTSLFSWDIICKKTVKVPFNEAVGDNK